MKRRKLTPPEILRVAAEAEVDPRSVRKWLAGGNKMMPNVEARIVRAVKTLGFSP
jgi:DNA-binding LacI/PurR family transcriptional regulator